MRRYLLILASLVALACHRDSDHSGKDTQDDSGLSCEDGDRDGWCVDEDCDDASAAVFPGAEEVCNGIDDDCDAEIDEDAPAWYRDADSDGFGDSATEVGACEPPEGWVETGGDCDDADSHTYPGAPELCDGLRNDCDLTEWTTSHEDGEVAWFDGSEWERVTTTYARGSEELPAPILLEQSGLLQFCEGTYYLHLGIKDSDVELVGLYGAETTVLHGAGSGQVVLSFIGDLTVSGLTVTGGRVESGTGFGGGVYVQYGHVEVLDAVLSDNEAWNGAGLHLSAGDAWVEGSVISGNTSWESGGGIGVHNGDLVVRHCDVHGNLASDDGGGLSVQEGTLTLENSKLFRNSALGYGGGAAVYEGTMTVSGSTLLENLAYSGGGVSVYTGDLEVRESTFRSNTTTDIRGNGGGVYLHEGMVTVEGSTFDGNKSGSMGNGGGLHLREGAVGLYYSELRANTGGKTGGGVSVHVGSVSLEDTLFVQNSADAGAGASIGTGSLTCTGSTSSVAGFEGNRAVYYGGGAAVFFEPEVVSDTCDWGTGSGENLPDDLALGYHDDMVEVYGLGDDESFTCDAKGCE